MLVAIMTQPSRAEYCRAYLAQAEFTSATVLVGDRSSFAGVEMPPHVEIRLFENKTVYRGRLNRYLAETRRALANWSRSGSTSGRIAGRLGRAAERMARRLRSLYSPGGSRPDAQVDRFPPKTDSIASQLESIHRNQPIDRIVVFDLFDLPSAIEFGEAAGVEVIVR